MRDQSPSEENASVSRQATPLQDLSAALTRSEAAFKMFRDFSVCGLRELVGASLQGLTNSSSLSAMDLYGRTVGEVENLLKEWKIPNLTVEWHTARKACSPENFKNTAWTIKGGDFILLLTDGEGPNASIVGIQKQQNRVDPDQ